MPLSGYSAIQTVASKLNIKSKYAEKSVVFMKIIGKSPFEKSLFLHTFCRIELAVLMLIKVLGC